MKINITIEIDDKELKGLFEEEKPKSKMVKYAEYSKEEWDRNLKLGIVLWKLHTMLDKYGLVSVADYKDILKVEGLSNELPSYRDEIFGWTEREIRDVRDIKIFRDYDGVLQLDMPETVCLL